MSNDHQRKALGKGLSALLPSGKPIVISNPPKPATPPDFEDFQNLPLDKIMPGPEQPREVFDVDRLNELAQSIRTNGLLQPITVQKQPDGKYRIIAGERRWRAAQIAGLKEIAALVRSVEQGRRLELALIENIQREDLNPLEVAAGFQRLVTEHHLSHEQIAERTGKDRSTVTNLLRLLKLGEFARAALKNGTISMGHARALLNLPDEDQQAEACQRIMQRRLSVRDTEAYVKRIITPSSHDEKDPEKLDPNVRAAVEEMAAALGTKVHLRPRRLEIEYYSPEDLERIYSVIVKQ